MFDGGSFPLTWFAGLCTLTPGNELFFFLTTLSHLLKVGKSKHKILKILINFMRSLSHVSEVSSGFSYLIMLISL